MPESVSLDEFCCTPSFSWPSVSPSGRLLAFYRDEDLSVLDIDSGTISRIEIDLAVNPNHRLVWDVSEEALFVHYCQTEQERTDIYALALDGASHPVITREGRCWLWDVSPDGRTLLYSHRRPDADLWDSPRTLYEYDRDDDTHTRLSPDDHFVMAQGITYSPTGEWIAYAAARESDGSLLEASDVYIARTDGSERRSLDVGAENSRTMVKDWHPSERQLLIYDTTPNDRCGVYDLPTDSVTWFGTGEIQEKPIVWLPDGERFLAIRKASTTTTPIVVDSQAEQTRELAVDGSSSYAPTAADDLIIDSRRILVPQSTPTISMELLAYDLTTDTTTQLLGPNDGIEPSQLVEPEIITYDSIDGCSIKALLYRTTEDPSPAVVLVHGGRHGRASKSYHPPSQYLVHRGFTVLRPNYRGSSGRGSAFRRQQYGDIGGYDALDIAAAGHWLRRRDWIESDRIAVYGYSYGGYLTYVQMVRYPTVWAAGIAAAGLTDLVAIYESNPDLPGLHEMGDTETNTALLRHRSPLTHVERFQGPLLMLHGEDDTVSPVSHARRFRDALLNQGREGGEAFEYHELDGQGHALIKEDNIAKHWTTVVDFLDRYLT